MTFLRFLFVTLVSVLVAAPVAHAESWCAYPLWVHEWGVQSFDGQGVPTAATLPSWFHQSARPGSSQPSVRDLPADGGQRALPVLHFYSGGTLSPNSIPVGIEVGFRRGAATDWYPQVQGLRTAAQANSPAAAAARTRLVAARAARTSMGSGVPLDRDPTRQLFWDRLDLSAQPTRSAHASTTPWIESARQLDSLWVNGDQESERFMFYEGATRERPLIRLERGSRYSPSRRHIVVHNRSAYPVHDVILTHREGERVFVAHIPRVPAGRRAGFILEEHDVAPADQDVRTRGLLRDRLVDTSTRTSPRMDSNDCTMMRDPAIPVESAVSHRLYSAEVDLLLQTWGAGFFDGAGTTLVYREDTTYLDTMLPISIYTDMYNYVVLHRAGLAVQRGVALP